MTQTKHTLNLIRACNLLSKIENGNGRPGDVDYLNKREMGERAKAAREIFEPIAILCRDHNVNPAAAPDLLEALEAAAEHLDWCGYGDKYESECAKDSKLPGKITAAIAKAKGGE